LRAIVAAAFAIVILNDVAVITAGATDERDTHDAGGIKSSASVERRAAEWTKLLKASAFNETCAAYGVRAYAEVLHRLQLSTDGLRRVVAPGSCHFFTVVSSIFAVLLDGGQRRP
jgi:hypothetical protein